MNYLQASIWRFLLVNGANDKPIFDANVVSILSRSLNTASPTANKDQEPSRQSFKDPNETHRTCTPDVEFLIARGGILPG